MLAIIIMILISVQPFAFRKIFLLIAALLGLSSAACFADPLFLIGPPPHTFHRQSLDLSLVNSAGGAKAHEIPSSLMNYRMRELRAISYAFLSELEINTIEETGFPKDNAAPAAFSQLLKLGVAKS